MCEDLKNAKDGSVVLFHATAHNPTGTNQQKIRDGSTGGAKIGGAIRHPTKVKFGVALHPQLGRSGSI